MRDLRKMATLLGGVVFAGAIAAGAVVGCSDDTSITVTGVDGGTDASSGDSAAADSGTLDAGDAGDALPNIEAGTIGQFAQQMSTIFCQRLATCCLGADASAYDVTGCANTLAGYGGFEYATAGLENAAVQSSGDLTYDPAKASECLSRLSVLSCASSGTGSVTTSPEYLAAMNACFAAVTGKAAAAAPCVASVECASTEYCDPDGGTCQPLLAAAAPCTNTGTDQSGSDQCSYRSSGAQCPSGTGVCGTLEGTGTTCATNRECQSGGCSYNYDAGTAACGSTAVLVFDVTTCDGFKKDGG